MNALRMLFLSAAQMILLGIWMTGFDKAHWFLYIPVAFFALAGITGICPGLIFWNKVGFKNEALACDMRLHKG